MAGSWVLVPLAASAAVGIDIIVAPPAPRVEVDAGASGRVRLGARLLGVARA